MAKKKIEDTNIDDETAEKVLPKKNNSTEFIIVNRYRQPQEVSGLGWFYRWEPRGLEGDTHTLTEKQFNSVQFQDQKKYFIVKEKKQ